MRSYGVLASGANAAKTHAFMTAAQKWFEAPLCNFGCLSSCFYTFPFFFCLRDSRQAGLESVGTVAQRLEMKQDHFYD